MKKFYCVIAYYRSAQEEEINHLSFAHIQLPAKDEDEAYELVEKYTDDNEFWYSIANFYVIEEGTDHIPK